MPQLLIGAMTFDSKSVTAHIQWNVVVSTGVVFRVSCGVDTAADLAAAKLAGREVASIDALLQCCLPNLQFPLSVCVDYLGFRVIATPVLPIDTSTMLSACKIIDAQPAAASPENDIVVIRDKRLDALFEMVAGRLNLRKHAVSGNAASPPVWLGVHVEGHLGHDGRRCKL